MILTELANLVIVRNHINVVLNDKSVTTKTEFRELNDIRTKLDKKFVESLKQLDVNTLLNFDATLDSEPETEIFNDPPVSVNVQDNQNIIKVTDSSEPLVDVKIEEAPKTEVDNTMSPEDSETLEKLLQAQKAKLKKEGRSNKRISK